MHHLTKNCREKMRYLALSWVQKGEHLTTVAARLDVSRKSVGNWLGRYLDGGLETLCERPAPGRPCRLPQQQMQTLPQLVRKLQQQQSGGRVMGKHVRKALQQRGVVCSLASVYVWLHKARISWVTSRSRHPKADPQAQAEFKKIFTLLARKAVGKKAEGKTVRVWFQDEARVGQQGTTTRMWAPKGTRPRALKQQEFESAYVFGSVCPATGACDAVVMPQANTEGMNTHLSLLSRRLGRNEHGVLVCDNASWHRSKHLWVPWNLTLLYLPAYSPELNPVEQVWQWLRQRFWSNRIFSDYHAIVESICFAWNIFDKDTKRVSSLCTRSRAALGT